MVETFHVLLLEVFWLLFIILYLEINSNILIIQSKCKYLILVNIIYSRLTVKEIILEYIY